MKLTFTEEDQEKMRNLKRGQRVQLNYRFTALYDEDQLDEAFHDIDIIREDLEDSLVMTLCVQDLYDGGGSLEYDFT